jgi:hypothetical protein
MNKRMNLGIYLERLRKRTIIIYFLNMDVLKGCFNLSIYSILFTEYFFLFLNVTFLPNLVLRLCKRP